ncbi:MAG: MBL fold metallo-hydrolase [Candidatus Woesearchaeota archaeon]
MEITKNIYKFSGQSNAYLIIDEEPKMIDAGVREEKEELLRKISQIIDKDKIKHILLTHLHYDHLGALDAFPQATIHASKEAIEDFQKNPFYSVFRNPEIDMLQQKKLFPVSDMGDIIVIPTPGHTRGSVCYYHKTKNILFSGDTLFGKGILGRTDLPTSDVKAMQESIKKLNAYSNAILCPGHDY